jgi:two-component system chemotaxis response regulator CheY
MPHKILVVDDHKPMRRKIRSLLESEGLDVCAEAANGREAIEKTKEYMPDLAILDLSMPVMSGFEAIPEMLKWAPQIKIVTFTVDDAEELRQHAFRLGVRAYVAKSGAPEALLAEVRKLLLARNRSTTA